MSSHYINTDVDLESSENLENLKIFLEGKSHVLFGDIIENGRWHIRIEAEESGMFRSQEHYPGSDFQKLITLLIEAKSRFSNEFQLLDKIDFNIGWQSSKERPEGTFTIAHDLLVEVVKLGATISVTIYPSDELEDIKI